MVGTLGGWGKTGGHNLLEVRTPLVPLVISPGGKESWSSGSVCSFDLQGELLGQRKQNSAITPTGVATKDLKKKKKQSLVSWLQAGTWRVASHSALPRRPTQASQGQLVKYGKKLADVEQGWFSPERRHLPPPTCQQPSLPPSSSLPNACHWPGPWATGHSGEPRW